MTTIAYRDGVMASDSLVADNRGTSFKVKYPKIAMDSSGNLYGVAGDYGAGCKVIDAIARQKQDGGSVVLPIPDREDRFEILIAYTDGRVRILTPTGEEIFDGCEYMAIGTGDKVALGAMFAGAGAVKAVYASIVHDTGTGGNVDAIEMPHVLEERKKGMRDYLLGRPGGADEKEEQVTAPNPNWKRPEPLNLKPETPEEEFDRIAREAK